MCVLSGCFTEMPPEWPLWLLQQLYEVGLVQEEKWAAGLTSGKRARVQWQDFLASKSRPLSSMLNCYHNKVQLAFSLL